MRAKLIGLVLICFLVGMGVPARSTEADEPRLVPAKLLSLSVVPQNPKLWEAGATQRFVVLAEYADGLERDVTSEAAFWVSNKDAGEIDNSGKFIARNSGEVVLTVRFANRSAKTVISVEHANESRPFTFTRNVGGILTKRGCNDTSCHGGVKGRGGFKLSPYALSPRDDYRWIVQGGTYRVLTTDSEPHVPRINRNDAKNSLVLLKPTFSIPHGGGVRFEVGSPDYLTILNWIKSGAPYGEEAEHRGETVERVEVVPKEAVLEVSGKQQFLVTAYLANGRQEDITEQSRFVAENPELLEVSETGSVHAKKPGETNLFVRTPGFALSARVGVIEKPVAHYPSIEARNYVDQYVFAKLRKFQIVPSQLSSDEEFLRRVCLDVTGTLPPPQRVREFLADKDPHKRDRLIDVLLNTPEYVDYWSFRFGDLMRATTSTGFSPEATKAYQDWVISSIANNKPYDVMARERIAGQGYGAPARNFYYVGELTTPETLMPELIRLFMGRHIECAQCHNHPFENWTQNQFWGLAAFFGGYTELRDFKLIVDVLGGGHVDKPKDVMLVTNPRTNERVVPTFLNGQKLPESQWVDPRRRLAEWITSHPYFAEATANRMWGYFFGRGIVDPVDDIRSSNPPSNEQLLEALAEDFRGHGFDLKHLIRTIVESRTYQLSGVPREGNKGDLLNYSHAQPRPLEAAVLLDAISSVTGLPEKFGFTPLNSYEGGATPSGVRAVQLVPDLCPSQFMDAYGRSMRKNLPAGPPKPNLLEALDMLAGPTYNSKISQEGGRLDRLTKRGASDEEIVEEFYLAALTRLPTPLEKGELLRFLAQKSSVRREILPGLVWAVLSSREFAYNH